MLKIKGLSNEDGIHHFELRYEEELGAELIHFLNKLGFSNQEMLKVDIPFSNVEYMYLHKRSFKIHLFVTNDMMVHMIIDCGLTQKALAKIMKDYFIFPK